MEKKTKISIGIIILLTQIIIFRDYIPFFQWGQIKVTGLACTCPDESVLGGRLYLRYITPDSLKEFNLDYSEVYVTEKPFVEPDWMGTDKYIIKGEIVGKRRISKGDPWNPIVKVNEWKHLNYFGDFLLLFFLAIELMVFQKWIKNKN